MSLVVGYWFARATDRVLIVPAKLPRNAANQLVHSSLDLNPFTTDRFSREARESSDFLRIIYAEHKPTPAMTENLKCNYTEKMNYTMPFFNYTTDDLVSIFNILDLDFMLPNIEKMELHDFYASIWTQNMTDWVMNCSHYDTVFVKNQPQLENTIAPESKRRRRKMKTFRRYQDITSIGEKYGQVDIWTFYHAFQFGLSKAMHWSMIEYHKSLSEYKIRYNEPIRAAARKVQAEFSCIPYVSVHIRATEPDFESILPFTVNASMENAINATTKWLQAEGTKDTIGIFILTDWPSLFEYQLFQDKLLNLKNHVSAYKTELVVFSEYGNSISGYHDIVIELSKAIGLENGDASMYLAQQVAACGAIGFFGTIHSTYSRIIENIRNSPCAC
eukprot:CAMPEP_0113628086 /NCGR_PEP_ID=MMETSP0017_2-20120614/14553_1 /TAXON_ID=2856 /ORGANISM="Cylindrotheca closterium" /LENGTH=387 /DNA_ID=CAMNT_0000538379 /DNA_START=452 /DNA_END=1615 /DNA_ORIENTATION=+ /assembly_acc=CAM_ASM_000147